jgi:Spy/CpxP family protein refolding chaperone
VSHAEPAGRARSAVVAALLLAATFITGIVAGIAADRMVLVREGRILPREGMRFVSARIVRAMDRELDLTDAQRADVEKILAARQSRIERVWKDLRPQIRAEIDRTNREIEAVLTEEQKPKFRKLTARWEARMGRLLGRTTP